MKTPNHLSTSLAFLLVFALAATTDAASIRNKVVKTINGTVQTLIDHAVDVILPIESTTSSSRRVWITYERGQHSTVLSTMEVSRIIPSHMTEIFHFPAMSSVVTIATDEEIAALLANSTLRNLTITDDPVRYPLVHSTRKSHQDQRRLQNTGGQTIPYGIELTQVDQLWEATGLTGAGITVCVIDTGLDVNNPDFDTSGYTGDSLVGGEWSFDSNGHGTHVTGIIAASNNGIGVVGAAPGVKIHTIDIFRGDELAYASALVDAVYKCRDAGAKIISMSLGGPVGSIQENTVFADLFDFNGILSIAASGNSGDSAYSYPASYENVLSVGAIDSSKRLASFSTFNDRVDLVAPGVDVLSTLPIGVCQICSDTFQSTYGVVSGTSQATPYVSGIAALLWSYNTNLGVEMIYNALINSAEDLGNSGRDVFYGNGLVSALAAYNELTSSSGTAPPATAPPLSLPTTPPASSPVTNPPGTSCIYASLQFRTDDFPEETFVKLSDIYSGAVLWYGSGTVANTDYSLPSTCLNPFSCYLFEFYDTYGDGLCCLNGAGFFELSLDNVPKATGTDFGRYVAYTIGYGCPA